MRHHRPFGKNVNAVMLKAPVKKIHVEEQLLIDGEPRPHMTYCRFFGLGGK